MKLKEEISKYPSFLSGGGEMGELVRRYDWKNSPLGSPEDWPQSLKTSVRICLDSRFPIVLWWGSDLRLIYNDAWRPSLGTTKHPWALGRPGREVWAEIWDTIGPMLNTVLETGEATWENDQLLLLERHGYIEESYWTYSYSAIRLETGQVGGVFAAVHETTDTVIGERQLRTLKDLGKIASKNKSDAEVYQNTLSVLRENGQDFPFALLYQVESSNLRLVGTTAPSASAFTVQEEIDLNGNESFSVVLRTSMQDNRYQVLKRLDTVFNEIPTGAWDIPAREALVIPLSQTGQKSAYAMLVVGLNPYRILDEKYISFFQLIADQISSSLSHVHAYEEERKRAEALAEINRAKTTFFSNISHELRTPLTLILSPVEEMLQQEGLPSEIKTNLEVSHRNALRLQKLVNSLLEFSRIEAGRVQATFQPVDLAKLTAVLADTFKGLVEKAGLQLYISCEKNLPVVYIDVDMWERIVLNLVSNAFKYTEKGEISVFLRKVDDRVELEVSDTGIGIPVEEQEKVFERFHRIQQRGGRSQEGTGIGLSLVQELVKLHKGSIRVQSEPDVGSTFLVSIPLGKKHLPRDKVIDREHFVASAKNLYADEASRWDLHDSVTEHSEKVVSEHTQGRVLLADDNADMRDYITRLLSSSFEVVPVNSGMQAYQRAVTEHFDLILSDVMMPGMTGFELVKKVKSHPATANVPIILLSARAGEEATIEGLQTGADDYLIKPFSARELLTRVHSTIQIAKARTGAEKDLISILKRAPVAVSIIRKENYVIELINEKSEAILQKQNLTGVSVFEAFPEAKGQGYEEILERAFSGEQVVIHESPATIFISGKLETIFLNVTYTPLPNARGVIDHIVSVGVDVTDLVVARKKAEENEAYFRKLANNVPVMIWRTDPTGYCNYLNQQWYEYTGQNEKDALGYGWLNYVHPDDATSSGEVFLKANEQHTFFSIHYRLRGRDGKYRHMIDVGYPKFGDDGQFEGFLGAVIDVHEQRMVELALEESDVRQKLAVEAAGMGTWEYDVASDSVFCSEKTREIFGFSKDPVSLSEVFDTIAEKDRDYVRDQVNKAMSSAEGLYKAEYLVNHPDGAHRAVVANGKFFFDDNNNPIKFIGTCLDVTHHKLVEETLEKMVQERTSELMLANKQLERSNEELEQFAYVTSHDLQEPLRKIQTFSAILSENFKENVSQVALGYLSKISKASERMNFLIRDLLNYSRLTRMEQAFQKVDLNDVIANIKNDFEVVIDQKRAKFLTNNLPVIEAIPLQMNQLFYNLTSNALKFAKEGVPVVIEVSCEPMSTDAKESAQLDTGRNYFQISFKDNGIGFKQVYAEKIFEIFQRLNARSVYEGTGIGLALVNRIVLNHQGRIRAFSEEGVGSTFVIMLPEKQFQSDAILSASAR